MSEDIQSALLERLKVIGDGMSGLVQRIERLELERIDTSKDSVDITFDDKVDYLEALLKNRHVTLNRNKRAYIASIHEMRRTEAYLRDLFNEAKAIAASLPHEPEEIRLDEPIEPITPIRGPPGPQGEQGEQGIQGLAGLQGERGLRGESVQGPPGRQGEEGPQGKQGEAGESVVGAEGPRGYRGQRGEKGNEGEAGESIEGPQGPQGPQGEKGDKGDHGEEGKVLKEHVPIVQPDEHMVEDDYDLTLKSDLDRGAT